MTETDEKNPIELLTRDGAEHPIAYRDFLVDRAAINEESRTVQVAFSSELPYERWWGVEILDHSSSAVNLSRLKDGGALLMDHDPRDQVGVIESARISQDKVGRATVRFSKSARGQEILQDVIDGIRTKISVGYSIDEIVLEKSDKEKGDTYRVNKWTPFEISFVSIPADTSVGVGRALNPADPSVGVGRSTNPVPMEVKTMTDKTNTDQAPEQKAPEKIIDVRAIENSARAAEIKRIDQIMTLCDEHKMPDLAKKALHEGLSVDEVTRQILDAKSKEFGGPIKRAESPDVGLTAAEAAKFSFVRALNALCNPNDRHAQEAAKFEYEVSAAAQKRTGKASQGVLVPTDILTRDLVVGTASAGGNLVATDLMAGDFISLLRNQLVVVAAGATMMTGLNGNVAIPRQSGGATGYWVAENGAPTESQQTIDQVALTPKTMGAFTDYSRRLLLQASIAVESFVRRDLAAVLAQTLETAAYHGTGASNQPTGVTVQAGIGSVAGGTNGLAPTWDNIIDLETAVSAVNGQGGGYITNAKVRGKLKRTQKFASTNGDPIWDRDNTLNGYPAFTTNAVSSTLTKGTSSGVCSAIIFGNWADLLIGMWGGVDLTIDPYTGSTAGTVRVVALQDIDLNIRHAQSFSAMLDALTV